MSEHTYKAFYMDKHTTLKASGQFDAWCKAVVKLEVIKGDENKVSVMLLDLDKNVTRVWTN